MQYMNGIMYATIERPIVDLIWTVCAYLGKAELIFWRTGMKDVKMVVGRAPGHDIR